MLSRPTPSPTLRSDVVVPLFSTLFFFIDTRPPPTPPLFPSTPLSRPPAPAPPAAPSPGDHRRLRRRRRPRGGREPGRPLRATPPVAPRPADLEPGRLVAASTRHRSPRA